MLQPKKTKYRKQFKGRIHGLTKGGATLNFGSFGLKALEPERITAIAHLREVLDDDAYQSLARKGEMMTAAAMAAYAYDQIDQARTELEHPG